MQFSVIAAAVFLGLASAAPTNTGEDACLVKARANFIPALSGCGYYGKRDFEENSCLLKVRDTIQGCGVYTKRDDTNSCLLKVRASIEGCGVYNKREPSEDENACLVKARNVLLGGCGYYG